VLAYAPLIEKRLRAFRKPHCGSIRVDETYIKIRGQWRYLYRAIDKHGNPVDFLLTAKRDLEAAKRFFRKALKDEPLLSPDRIGTDGAGAYPPAIAAARKDGLLARTPVHYVTKHLQQGIESDHFRVKRPMPRIGCFRAFHTVRRTLQGGRRHATDLPHRRIHGRFDLLSALLAQIESHRPGRDRTIVFLGDYIDQGPDSAGVAATVAALAS